MRRTTSGGFPFGSSSGQSSIRIPGTYGHASPQPIVTSRLVPAASSVVSFCGFAAGQVDADLAHHRDDLGVNVIAGSRACRDCARRGGIREGIEERGRHLRSAGVVHAGKQVGLHLLTVEYNRLVFPARLTTARLSEGVTSSL